MFEEGITMDSSIQRIACMSIMVCVLISVPVSASLSMTNFGFPVIVRSSSSISFNTDHSFADDLESMNINFPGFDGLMSPSGTTSPGVTAATSIAAPDLGHMGSLFDFSKFRLH
jgi:hypothetical protein